MVEDYWGQRFREAEERAALLAEATETMERLGAKPWLERVEALTEASGEGIPA